MTSAAIGSQAGFGLPRCLRIKLTSLKVHPRYAVLPALIFETECKVAILMPKADILFCFVAWYETFLIP